MTETDSNIETPDQFLAAFERAEKARAFRVGAVTFAAIAVALVALGFILNRVRIARDDVTRAKLELGTVQLELAEARVNRDSLAGDIQAKTKQLETLTLQSKAAQAQLSEVKNLVTTASPEPLAKRIERVVARPVTASVAPGPGPAPPSPSVPIEQVAHVRLSLAPTKDSVKDRPVYQVRIWTDLPKEYVAGLLKAEYTFDHPSFVPNTWTSFDANAGFSVSYRGYGCVPAKAALVKTDGSRHEIPFDMCALWVGAKPH